MFPAYISSKVLLMEYLQNYAVLIDFHWLGLSAHFTDWLSTRFTDEVKRCLGLKTFFLTDYS